MEQPKSLRRQIVVAVDTECIMLLSAQSLPLPAQSDPLISGGDCICQCPPLFEWSTGVRIDFGSNRFLTIDPSIVDIGQSACAYAVPGIIGTVSLTSGLHFVVTTRTRFSGQLHGFDGVLSGIHAIDQVAVVSCADSTLALSTLAEAFERRTAPSLAGLSPIDYTRTKSLETVKAGVGLGVDTVKAGVGLGMDTVKAGVGIGMDTVKTGVGIGVGIVSSIGSTTLSVIGMKRTKSKKEKDEIEIPATEIGNTIEIPSTQPRKTAVGAVSRMVSSLYPFRPNNPLSIANTRASDESSESSDRDGDNELAETSDSVSVDDSASSGQIPLARTTSNQNMKTLMDSIGSVAQSTFKISKHIAGVSDPPITAESIQPNDIRSLFELQTFFFSDGTWDLTRSSENQIKVENSFPDDRFFWNKKALEGFFKIGAPAEFLVPVIQGYVEISKNASIGSGIFDFALVSRRSKYMAGFRYEKRGVDELGQVANFVETEMIVRSEQQGRLCSHLQIRGSIPLFWKQIASTKTLNPTPILEKTDEENSAAMAKHLSDLESRYSSVVMVDLVGQKGREAPLSTRFKTVLSATLDNDHSGSHENFDNTKISYRDYDFHARTRGLHYERIAQLVEMLETELDRMGYFCYANDGKTTVMSQTGTVRTNCMDCLDRTNVVQSVLARFILEKMLLNMGIEPNESSEEKLDLSFDMLFKNIWANNGDRLSAAYTGTGALKGDFTRTGVRDVKGMLNDAANSVSRLYADNFQNKKLKKTNSGSQITHSEKQNPVEDTVKPSDVPPLPQKAKEKSISLQTRGVTVKKSSNDGKPSKKYQLSDFQIYRTLGTGSFGRVHMIRIKSSGAFYAMKVLIKNDVVKMKQVEHTNNERKILSKLEYPFLVCMTGTAQDAKNLYIVLEFVQGGELFSFLRRSGRFKNSMALFYAAEVVLAFEYLHNRDIVYRDLKPENLLIDAKGHIKITDFGFAKEACALDQLLVDPQKEKTDYLAPEIIQSKGYGKAVDWWALGVLIYEMLAGHPPFYDEDHFKLYEKILQCKPKFPSHFDSNAKDLIKNILTTDLTKRFGNLKGGVNDIKAHAWFSDLDWQELEDLKIPAPYLPPYANEGDASNFDDYPEDYEPYGSTGHDPHKDKFPDF
ncbi:camp-dependent protein kinase catalytic subunit [Entophlyctis luteolus]|nr:camp-dependent protein kinase catalytic subunit [Entophlyctis luteolus]